MVSRSGAVPGSSEPARVSVVVCTRNRPHQLARCIRSILNSDHRHFDLLVIDQSEDDSTARLVHSIANTDGRVRLYRDDGQGASRARNIGIRETRSELIVFTDDDCAVRPDWLGLMLKSLLRDPRAGVAFGTVLPASVDPADGFIVGYSPPGRRRRMGRLAKLRDGGIGANMALQRSALEVAGGFDEQLGPGSHFPSCEEGDLAYRILKSGFALHHVPEAVVIHYGVRDWTAGSRLLRDTYTGIASAYMKHVRMGDPAAVLLVLQVFWLTAFELIVALMRRRGPYGFGRLFGIVAGVWRSFELSVDRERGLYVRSRKPDAANAYGVLAGG